MNKLTIAIPKGRILKELVPIFEKANIKFESDFYNPSSRKLLFGTNIKGVSIIKVRSFDVATFVAFGAAQIGIAGNEIGTTTGRTRTVNWLNMDKLIQSINITGSTIIIISKVDILKEVNIFKLIINNEIIEYKTLIDIMNYITDSLHNNCPLVTKVIYSDSKEHVLIG